MWSSKQMAQRVVRRVRPSNDAHASAGVVDQEVGEIRDADDVASGRQPRSGQPRLLIGQPPLAEPHDVAIVERRRAALDRYRGAGGPSAGGSSGSGQSLASTESKTR